MFELSVPPAIPAMPFLMPPNVLYASHAEYRGIAIHRYHALSPKTLATAVQPHDQYNTSHIYSVNPLASRSSPDFLSSPLGAYAGQPIVCSQNSMMKAGNESAK